MSASIPTPQLSAALVAYLRREGKNLREIGEMVGLSESFVSRVASGERSFTIEHLTLFEEALGEPLPALIMQAMWVHDLRPDQQSDFDAALQLLRELGSFRQSLGTAQRADVPVPSPAQLASPKPKRAVG